MAEAPNLDRLACAQRSRLARLLLLASLRDPESGRYHHTDAADHALRAAHERVFAEWLSRTLEQQTADLLLWFASSDEPTELRLLRLLNPHLLPPASAAAPERKLFLCDLQLALAVAATEHGGVPLPLAALDHRVVAMMKLARVQHGNAHLTLKSLSHSLRSCERHLGRLFQKHTGFSFRAYLRRVRLREAAARLLRASEPVSHIALASGYEDSANFAKDFKRCFGLTPAEFRVKQTGRP